MPALRRGDVVIFDNLSSHLSPAVPRRSVVPGRAVLPLPTPYSPDFNPIEEMFSKFKEFLRRVGARAKEHLYDASEKGYERSHPRTSSAGFARRGVRHASVIRCNPTRFARGRLSRRVGARHSAGRLDGRETGCIRVLVMGRYYMMKFLESDCDRFGRHRPAGGRNVLCAGTSGRANRTSICGHEGWDLRAAYPAAHPVGALIPDRGRAARAGLVQQLRRAGAFQGAGTVRGPDSSAQLFGRPAAGLPVQRQHRAEASGTRKVLTSAHRLQRPPGRDRSCPGMTRRTIAPNIYGSGTSAAAAFMIFPSRASTPTTPGLCRETQHPGHMSWAGTTSRTTGPRTKPASNDPRGRRPGPSCG